MADRAMALGQEPRVLVTRVACSHLGRHVIGGRALSDVGWNDGVHEVGVLRLGHGFKSYSRHRIRPNTGSAVVTSQLPIAQFNQARFGMHLRGPVKRIAKALVEAS